MDQPGLDPADHHAALRDLALINYISGSGYLHWGEVHRLLRTIKRPLRLLDIATGGGDVPIDLWKRAAKRGLPLEVSGCDFSPLAVEHATALAKAKGVPATFFRHDILADPLPAGFDIVTCSLFLHHLDDTKAVLMLRRMREAASELALVNDLERSRVGWIVAFFGTRILGRSRMTWADGVVSVEGAYMPREALALARKAGWSGATVERRFPMRYLMKWSRT